MHMRLTTGIPGLDHILYGGLLPGRTCLVRGGPGTGKTTLGMHFLSAGARAGEPVLCITFGESEAQIRSECEGVGIDHAGISFLDMSPTSDFFAQAEMYDIFSPAEIEREPLTQQIVDEVRSLRPKRIFLDGMTQIRYLSSAPFHFHKQTLSFLRFLVEQGATVVAASEASPEAPDADLQFLCDAVINLELTSKGRYLHVSKLRGSAFRKGPHTLRLTGSGALVSPRLVPEEHRRPFPTEVLSSGLPELDALLHGGIERGTITIITGPTGVGKTTLGAQFMKEAAGRGMRSALFTFEEEVEVLLRRCESVNIPVRNMIEQQRLSVIKIEPLQYTPDELAQMVRIEVEDRDTRIVMLDSLSGYQLSLTGDDLVSRLHALCKYCQNSGVTTLLINEKEHISGPFTATESGISYLGDNIVYLRYMENRTGGTTRLGKCVGVLKKRLSSFDSTLREVEMTPYGLKVYPPMQGLGAMLQGLPIWSASGDGNGAA